LILHFFLFFCPVKWAFEMRKGVKSEIDKLKEIEIKIDIIDGLLEFLMKKSNGCNFYKEKIEKYETMKVKFFNLKEDILLEIEIIKCQLPPSNYF